MARVPVVVGTAVGVAPGTCIEGSPAAGRPLLLVANSSQEFRRFGRQDVPGSVIVQHGRFQHRFVGMNNATAIDHDGLAAGEGPAQLQI